MKKKLYIKDESSDPIYSAKNKAFIFKSRILPTILILGGLTLLTTQVAYPLVFFTSRENTKPAEASVLGLVSGFREFEFEELPQEKSQNKTENIQEKNKFFLITIPKLRIENALIEINSTTLNPEKSLGHYKGSAIPGEIGNSFIYGHSVLPWFYNPKNYKTIFSTLDQLDTGDIIYIDSGERKFTYIVEGKESLKPSEVDPLKRIKPAFLNESTITLMTCSPPGTKLKRLMVYATLERP